MTGAFYLIWLGVKTFCSKAEAIEIKGAATHSGRRLRAHYVKGLLVGSSNPKAILFFTAFFPQFLVSDAPIAPQVALLSATFFVIAVGLDCGWALLAGRLRGVLAMRGRLRNRLSGGFLMGAGIGLALARRE